MNWQLLLIGTGLMTGIVAVVGSAILLWRNRGSAPLGPNPLAACVPMMLFLVGITVFFGVAKGQYSDWDAARLAISVAVTRGHDVYSTLDTGSVQTAMYPPGWILAYLPTACGQTPTTVMLVGYVLAQCYTVLPVLILCLMLGNWRHSAWVGLAIFMYLSLQSLAMQFACTLPHADAPALGFALMAALSLYGALRHERLRALWVICTALFACLSVASKQTMVALPVVLLLWSSICADGKFTRRLLISLCVIGGASLGLALIWFPLDGMFFNLVTMPGRHPWKGHAPFNLLLVAQELGNLILVPTILVILGAGWMRHLRSAMESIKHELWPLLVLVAVGFVPFSLLGRVKVGGADSALAPTVYFMCAALVAIILACLSRLESDAVGIRSRTTARATLLGIIFAFASMWMLQTLQEIRYGIRPIRANLAQEAYDYLVANPSAKAYFPAYPLAHLLAEDNLYHFALAIADREQEAGFPISEAQRAAHFPLSPDLVCWSKRLFKTERQRVPDYFTDYRESVVVDALPAFRCYRRPVHP
ncbi:MAG: hypothetical protein O3A51_00400 [Verrucomicrobia bacterium]|nr:hypothetical protein [Verrucomicrobiota bacterium]